MHTGEIQMAQPQAELVSKRGSDLPAWMKTHAPPPAEDMNQLTKMPCDRWEHLVCDLKSPSMKLQLEVALLSPCVMLYHPLLNV